MQRTIALESGVQVLRPYLEDAGYRVVDLGGDPQKQNLDAVDAVIISGLDENLNGDSTRVTPGWVVNARGRQPEEILYDLEKHFRFKD